jgi:hypothetical protein
VTSTLPRLARVPAVWILILAILATVFYVGARRRRDFVDFMVYQQAGVRAIHAEPLYRAEDGHYQFKYWPAFALAMAPFAPIDPEVAKVLWYAISVVLLVVFVRQSIRLLPDRHLPVRALVWITAIMTLKFVVKELVNGQTNVLLGVLLLAALSAHRRGRPLLAGAAIGAAIFVKPYALLMLPWAALAFGVPAFAAALGVVLAGLLLPALAYGWQGNIDLLAGWFQTVTSTTPENLLFGENISLATMWAKWLGPGQAASMLALASGVALLGLVAAVWLIRRRVSMPNYLELSLLMLVIPLLSPQGWDYVLILGTPAIVCVIDRWEQRGIGWRLVTASALAITSLAVFDTVGRVIYAHILTWSAVSVAAILLAVSLAHLRWRRLA